jgi:hypothetical protein
VLDTKSPKYLEMAQGHISLLASYPFLLLFPFFFFPFFFLLRAAVLLVLMLIMYRLARLGVLALPL